MTAAATGGASDLEYSVMSYRKFVTICTVAILLFSQPSSAFAQSDGGFGKFSKKKVRVTTLVPPKLILTQSSYSLAVAVPSTEPALRDQIQNQVDNFVKSSKSDIQAVEKDGELKISINVNRCYVDQKAATSKSMKFIGSSKPVTKVFLKFDATYRVESVLKGKTLLIAQGNANLDWDGRVYDEANGQSAPPPEYIKLDCIQNLVSKLQRLVIEAEQEFPIELPDVDGNKLELGIRYAESGEWSRALESWSSIGPFQPKAEAYRQFVLGLGNEVLAYDTFRADKSPEKAHEAIGYLEKARDHFAEAIRLKPDESRFAKELTDERSREPVAPSLKRVKEAIDLYKQWGDYYEAKDATLGAAMSLPDPEPEPAPAKQTRQQPSAASRGKSGGKRSTPASQQTAGAKSLTAEPSAVKPETAAPPRRAQPPAPAPKPKPTPTPAAKTKSPPEAKTEAAPPGRQVRTNEDVIELHKSGMSASEIIRLIEASTDTRFDLSMTAYPKIVESGVPRDVYEKMKQKQESAKGKRP